MLSCDRVTGDVVGDLACDRSLRRGGGGGEAFGAEQRGLVGLDLKCPAAGPDVAEIDGECSDREQRHGHQCGEEGDGTPV